MIAEMVLTAESLAADVARVRSFIGMCALVDQQIVGLGELTVAELADELLLGAGGATRTTEEARVVLTRVKRWHVAGSEPRAHKKRNAVRVLEAKSGLLSCSIYGLLSVGGGGWSGGTTFLLLLGVLGGLSCQLG